MANDRISTHGLGPVTLHLALRPRDAAKALGISERLLWSLTAPRGTIRSVRVGNCVLYPVGELRAWLDRQAQATSEGGAA